MNEMCRIRSIFIYTVCFLLLMLFLLFYILGAARYVTDFEENTCDMTYMFEYPQYVRISLDNEIEQRYPRYGLYAYGEGFVTEKLRRMFFSGIPVLFIPGNVGSHEQVRSLASVSLRKSLNDRTPFHFDYFTVSLGKDYSALYGGVLMDETTYVSHCIRKILSLYKTNVESIVLIGHSMGGIIAKGSLVMTPNVNASVASIIFTLATPHIPTLVLDHTFASYYHNLEDRLSAIKDAGTSVISIGGGPRDILITPTQTLDTTANINVISNTVPAVWKSTDHLSILWCKQLVFSVVRSLFDCVSYAQRQARIFPKSEERIRALSYHLNHRASGKKFYSYKEKIQFEFGGEWIENIQRNYAWSNENLSKRTSPVYLMIRLNGQPDHLTIDTTNLETKDWLFVCSASSVQGQSRVCNWGWNLTNRTRIMPDPLKHRLRKTVDLDLQDLLKYSGVTHVVVRILPDSLEDHVVTVNVDLYSYDARVIGPIGGNGLLKDLLTKPKVRRSDLGHVRYYVLFGEFINTVTVELKVRSECTDPKHAMVELQEPWSVGVSQIQFFTVVDNGPKTMKVQTRPRQPDVFPSLRLTLDPACSYMIDIKKAGIIDRISCIVRDRWHLLYTTAVALLLLILSTRITHGHERTPILVITICLSFCYELTFECLVASAILCVFTIGLCCSVVLLGSLAHSIAVRFLARAIAFSTTWSDWLLGGLNQLPFITALLVLSLIPATCGALAMIVSVFLYFLNLTRMYEDYLEELLMGSLRQHFSWMARFRSTKNNNEERHDNDDNEDTKQKIFNHLLFFLLWCLTAIPAVPSALVWARNFSYDMRLSNEDPLLLQSWILLVTYSTMGWVQIPSNDRKIRSQILSSILCFLGWVVLLMGATPRPSFCQYYVPPVMALAIGTVALNFIFL
ncbi:GPI inositol-deacylase isoform X2 [Ceratina calcarata]|uniref:GPI inositol-deacylase n=1 Tax=Ceratina calcarata TaxID=156304 RepID=A0AAJ7JA66_9HYME|nr:GPI inositol-deacylase isoform X2 [Ceratina calcarata]